MVVTCTICGDKVMRNGDMLGLLAYRDSEVETLQSCLEEWCASNAELVSNSGVRSLN